MRLARDEAWPGGRWQTDRWLGGLLRRWVKDGVGELFLMLFLLIFCVWQAVAGTVQLRLARWLYVGPKAFGRSRARISMAREARVGTSCVCGRGGGVTVCVCVCVCV